MYLSQTIGNISQKFNSQTVNISYDLSNSFFDIHIGLCNQSMFCIDDKLIINEPELQLACIRPEQQDLFSFNLGLSNNLLAHASHNKFIPAHINNGIFIHSKKPTQIKKEDLLLIDNNIKKSKKIFFNSTIASSWKLINSEIIEYGISTSHFYKENSVDDRTNKILLISFDKNQNLNMIKQILSANNIEFDILDTMIFDIKTLRTTLNKYKICLDLSENIINLITAISCGCIGIAHNTNGLKDSFQDVPNLYFGDSIGDIIQNIRNHQHNSTIVNFKDYFETNFGFHKFEQKIASIIYNLNRETFYI